MGATTDTDAIDTFIARWAASSGAERANFQLFATELCDLMGVPRSSNSGGPWTRGISLAIAQQVKRFNGHVFRDAKVHPFERHEIGELLVAVKHN